MANKKRDLIDRGQIQYTWWELPGGKYTDGVTLQSVIHLMPTVDAVEVVHGEWEKQQGIYSCSICGKACPYDVQADIIQYWTCNYCPNCGAKMDGDKK